MSRIAELAAQANAMHARVSSIFQHGDGWDCRLKPSRFIGQDAEREVFGRGATPEEATENAVELLRKVDSTLKDKVSLDPPAAAPRAADDLDDILE